MGIFDGLKGALASATSSTIGSAVDSIGNLANDLFNTRADKDKANQFESTMKQTMQTALDAHTEKMAAIYEQQYESKLKDMQDARNREIQLNESASAGWLSKNVISLIALFVAIIWGGLTVYLLLRMLDFIAANPNVKMDVILGLYAGLSATMGILMNYYFGTSHSAVEKDKTIATIAKQP